VTPTPPDRARMTLCAAATDLVLSSPPFLALRSYLPPDHPDKAKEIGSEPTPAGPDGLVYEHRMMAWDAGLLTDSSMHVHHRNGEAS
jgi:hypothetical protein